MTNNTNPRKIVVTGPENSGKTTLAKMVSNCLGWPLVPEKARSYLRKRKDYDLSDLRKICNLQHEEERRIEGRDIYGMVCDTDHLTIHIWAWLKFGRKDIGSDMEVSQPDLYVLCYPDVPYEPDMQREDTGRTKMLFDLYLLTLMERRLPFIIARGGTEDRLLHTLEAIKTL